MCPVQVDVGSIMRELTRDEAGRFYMGIEGGHVKGVIQDAAHDKIGEKGAQTPLGQEPHQIVEEEGTNEGKEYHGDRIHRAAPVRTPAPGPPVGGPYLLGLFDLI